MMVDKSDIKDHFDKYVLYMYCFAGKKQVHFHLGTGSGYEFVQTTTGFQNNQRKHFACCIFWI
jgi:hypothetical protein